MKRATVLTTLAALACAPRAARADVATPPPLTRERVTDIIANRFKIVSPNGIEELLPIDVNGTKQWISIRGRDARNPVLLYLHGGPGSPTMPEAWTFQAPWEDFFTVVQWDQRGAGKTFASNGPAAPLTSGQMISDSEAVVRYLLRRLNKKRIFVLGHSWGSFLGLTLAERHPELLHAYLGTGQIIDMLRSEEQGFNFALESAKAERNAKAVRELEAIAPYPGSAGLTFERVGTQRQWLMYYGGLSYGRRDFQYDADAWSLAPEYTRKDLDAIDRGGVYSVSSLLPTLAATNFERVTNFHCPVFMFIGRHDRTTSASIVADWFARVRAPRKGLVWFENSAHMAMIEEPGRYLVNLVDTLLPLAAEKGRE